MDKINAEFSQLHYHHSLAPTKDFELSNSKKYKYRKLSHENNLKTIQHYGNCEWMKKHGKGEFVDFSIKERAKIRSVFKELDADQSGALDLNELYEPLLALGLVETKKEVKLMMDKVDTNGSGVIEYSEFLKILKQSSSEDNTLINFFKNLSKPGFLKESKDLSFNLIFSSRRREIMMQAYLGKSIQAKDQGKRILYAFASYLKEKEKNQNKIEKLNFKQNIELKKFFDNKNKIKSRSASRGEIGTFITSVGRSLNMSRRPMTRKSILQL